MVYLDKTYANYQAFHSKDRLTLFTPILHCGLHQKRYPPIPVNIIRTQRWICSLSLSSSLSLSLCLSLSLSLCFFCSLTYTAIGPLPGSNSTVWIAGGAGLFVIVMVLLCGCKQKQLEEDEVDNVPPPAPWGDTGSK